MACTAACTGLRQGEEFALTIWQIAPGERVIDVDRKVAEAGGKQYAEPPKGRKRRKTIYPRLTPSGYPLAEKIQARIEQVHAEMAAGRNPLGLMFPSPRLWRDTDGNGDWTWHSNRHAFCVTALFTWKLDATDVSCMAGHANARTTLVMSVRHHQGVLDRARTATQ